MFSSKKYFYLWILAILLVAGLSSGCGKKEEQNSNDNTNETVSQGTQEPEKTKFDHIKDLFAEKHSKDLEEIEFIVTHETETHLRGNVSMGEGQENRALFLAAKNDGVWEIVFEGNGSFSCSLLEEQAFPPEMKEGCYVPAKVTSIFEQLTWSNYQNKTLGYSLNYPTICSIVGVNVDDQIDLICNWQGDGTWPRFRISHHDTDFYRPDLGTSVVEWVKKHPEFDLGSPVKIAGLETVHFTQKKSNENDAADYYYFIKGQQLYEIMILHVDGKKDQKLYDKFLADINFDE